LAIARVADAADIATVIRFARDRGLDICVRAGGHSNAGHSSTETGIVIDVRDLRVLAIDPKQKTAVIGSGLTAVEIVKEIEQHGLTLGFGDTGSVGVAGITLGGGIGYLTRLHGLTLDSVKSIEMVTADGEFLFVDATSHPDLFWAMRGAGANFGVVTSFEFNLQPSHGFVGGMMVLPATVETIVGFMRESAAAPEELGTIANVMPCPPLPFVAEEHHGKMVIFAMLGYTGNADDGVRAIAPFRALAEPYADLVKPGLYSDMYPPEDDSYRPKAVAWNMFLDRVDEAAARTMLAHLEASDAPLRAVQLRALGGAMARVPNDATAFGHRDKPVMAQVVSFHSGDDLEQRRAWVRDLHDALDQGVPGAYVNFLGDEPAERVHDAYPTATYERLARVKAHYDPDNVFRNNWNIPPAR
jgi:FAD/FMN-containing dehydrogenase